MPVRSFRLALFVVLLAAGGCRLNCRDLEGEADSLLEANQSCTADEDCVAGPSIHCMKPCFTVVNKSADQEALGRQFDDIGAEYADSCGCIQASCIRQEDVRFACVEHACTIARD